jgi:S-adenosyl methyltransferase
LNEPAGFNPAEPNAARVWDHLLGGKDNYQADRDEAERLLDIEPRLRIFARANRLFINQAVHWLALRCGVRQFLDLGCGLPLAAGNIHQVAQAVSPTCRIVYADKDAMAAVHAAAMLAHGSKFVDAMLADLADPAAVLARPELTGTLDLTRPVAVIFGMVLHFMDAAEAAKIVAGYMGALAGGSYVVVSCGSGDDATGGRLAAGYQPDRLRNHTPEQIAGFLDGLDVIPPGVVDVRDWKPGAVCAPPSRDGAHVLVAVARKLSPLAARRPGTNSPKPRPASAASPWNERQFKYACPIAQMVCCRDSGSLDRGGRWLRLPGPGPGIRPRT